MAADILISDSKKIDNLNRLKEDIDLLTSARTKLAEAIAIRADEATLLAQAIARADSDVASKQSVIDAISVRLQALRAETNADAAYSAVEKQEFVDAINNEVY